MPPQFSDDEGSISDASQQEISKEGKSKGKSTKAESEPDEELRVESDAEGDGEQGEDEYVVEKILNHAIDEKGVLIFQVKWEGYDKKSELTWEPEENLETAQDILNSYLELVGGRKNLMEQFNEKKAEAAEKKQGKKRGRPSTGPATPQASGKKSRRNSHPSSTTPPASLEPAQFKPPSGSWEDDVLTIEAMEGPNAEVVVYLTWKGGHKSQHPLHAVYKRCPQKMLSFYERHLVFKKTEEDS
ncbi:hypothetical protein DSL72_006996 [Monilinia vaccinii-corymbosi]|uniref:Chromo domain-containing protein n=1 Tax=Monilinia vaccinii-corymbosi TaxID=61207 RepID=A0A8A3PLP8_9HELO|nr:hypothetical protein DSL72_006996 [Monilinia vaccinii-corymbosi]